MEEPSQFPVGQTAQSLTCYITKKPPTGLDDCLNMLPACFRKGMSGGRRGRGRRRGDGPAVQQRDRPVGRAEGERAGAVRAEEQDYRHAELPSGRTA